MKDHIIINGLTKMQAALAEIIWECQTQREVESFIKALPTPELRQDARNLVEIMIIETIDQAYDGLGSLDEATELLDKIKR